ncbi:MAG TPA: hypothetical protein VLW17_02165 [Thermoanaerobaculaceae bacterium]|nr:hypothetical protein [Thermoanaerobaculaceae bacterium]
MPAEDPIGDLVLLARAAAEEGRDWRSRLRREWLPAVLATAPRSALAAALHEWSGTAPEPESDLASAVESAVIEAMAASGYD